jgi:hypothetical protein
VKNNTLRSHRKSLHISRHPASDERRFAIVTDVRRDAVDADGAIDERHMMRTVKTRGPDASTLASSL